MAFEAALESMVGVIPLALTGGIVLNLTQQAMRIPGRISAEQDTYRRPTRRVRRKPGSDDILHRTFGV